MSKPAKAPTEATIQISAFAEKIWIKKADPQNWLRRVQMQSEYEAPQKGLPRRYSRGNVIELALVAALLNAGHSLSDAVDFAGLASAASASGFVGWALIPVYGGGAPKFAAEISPLVMAQIADASAHRAVTALHVGLLVASVDALFD